MVELIPIRRLGAKEVKYSKLNIIGKCYVKLYFLAFIPHYLAYAVLEPHGKCPIMIPRIYDFMIRRD